MFHPLRRMLGFDPITRLRFARRMRRKTCVACLVVVAACGDSSSNDGNGDSGDGGSREDATVAGDGAADARSSDATSPGDGAIADGASSDGATDSASSDGGTLAEGGAVYNDLNDPTKWEAVRPGSAGVMGAAFDGR